VPAKWGLGKCFFGCVFSQNFGSLIILKDHMALLLGEGGGERPDRLNYSPLSVVGDVSLLVRSLTWTIARRRYYLELICIVGLW